MLERVFYYCSSISYWCSTRFPTKLWQPKTMIWMEPIWRFINRARPGPSLVHAMVTKVARTTRSDPYHLEWPRSRPRIKSESISSRNVSLVQNQLWLKSPEKYLWWFHRFQPWLILDQRYIPWRNPFYRCNSTVKIKFSRIAKMIWWWRQLHK